jgi:two-component system CheB/CheR fusion protein
MAKHHERSLPSQLAFPIVGMGASAGGIEALIQVFEALPASTGAAFVIVLHLSPDHASNLAQVLQTRTNMPVQQVTGPARIEANQVYVIAPNYSLTMVDGYLRVAPQETRNDRGTAIDLFFRSLAEAHRERAVCVVLSGAGSDGSVGLTRVKELGGIAIAQDPEEADYSSMPRSAISTGQVDFVISASDIPQRLMDLWNTASHIRLPVAPDDEDEQGEPELQSESNERALREIMVILRTRTSHDFRHYKRATVLRRIERRLQVNGVTDLQQYRDYLHLHPEETPALLQDMLISVTNFFRDKEAFDALRDQVLPRLFEHRGENEPIRVWAPGCATGEEAYTLAMLLQEASANTPEQLPFQVFATDIDENAVAIARNGLYPEPIVADVDPSRIRQFFSKDAAHFRVRKELRERVLFALHNVLSDPPFSRLDLICCRNLLIYLDRSAQAEILRIFHFALRPNGYLFLGSSEAADSVSNLFSVVDKKARIYRANVAVRVETPVPLSTAGIPNTRLPVSVLPPAGKRRFSFGDLHQRLIEQYAPPSVLVSRDSEIVHLSDRAGRFLQYAGGEPSHNIIAAVRPELRLELRTAIYQALQNNHSVEARRVQLARDGRHFFVNMTARPVHDAEANGDFVLVLFDEVEDSMGAAPANRPGDERDPIIVQLERELQRTREQLQATVEQSETSTEELKASNEELQAINEELRSATEELETSKEELQSINEELTTVNAELKSKVEETGKINDDLRNLITANDIGTVFVDRNLRIKRYTPRATDVFSIIPSDIGRSLLDITHRLEYDKLADDAAEAFDSLRLIERELQSVDGRWYLARFLPYRTTEDRIEGAVLSFIDITSRRAAEDRLREGEKRMNIVAESTRDYAIITLDDDGLVTSWNTGAERIFGYAETDMLGQPCDMLYTPEDQAIKAVRQEMGQARLYGRVEEDRWQVRKDGSRFRASGVLSRLDQQGVSGFAKIMRDLDELALSRLAERSARTPADSGNGHPGEQAEQRAERLRDEFLAVVSHELKHPLNLISASAELISRSPEVRQNQLIQRATATIRRTVMGQAHIIDDLLDMSRLRTGKLSIARGPVDLTEVVERVCHAIEEEARRKDITLECSLPPQPTMIDADLTRIEQILWNLVSNALKYTNGGGAITVKLAAADDEAVLEVRDTGAGIDAESLPHIFDMFRQGTALSGRQGGLGIGLSLVRELVTMQGGTARAESEGLGKGAAFTIAFPLREDIADPSGAEPVPPLPLESIEILLVDDDPGTVETFKLLLEMEGARVTTATSGQAALDLLALHRPDLLLSDLGMPGMDGQAFIGAVRARRDLDGLLAIALSGYGRPGDIRRSMHAGFDAHLTKPIALDALLNAIRELHAI